MKQYETSDFNLITKIVTRRAKNINDHVDAIRRRREIDRRGWSRERSQDDFSHHIYNPSTSLFDDTFAKRRNNLPETAAPQPPAPFIRTALLSSRWLGERWTKATGERER